MDEQELENTEQNQQIEEQDSSELEKIEIERKAILNRVVSGNIQNIQDRVAFILNNDHDARNSDIDLAWSYWQAFEAHRFNGQYITKEQLRVLTKLTSLTRARAKIQNEYKLFQADDDVKKFRGVLEEDHKAQAVEDKPMGLGVYSVYIDETGKTQDYLSVGSLWVSEIGSSFILSHLDMNQWKKRRNIDFEFHFSQLSRIRIEDYKSFFITFLSLYPAVSFKLIVVNNKGFADTNKAITDLTYHLIKKGIDHENTTGRASLPRMLQVWIDEEEKGSDELKLENIKERITGQKIEGLYLDKFQAISSEDNYFIQIIDLFTGAINRKLHSPDGNHFKDEFANFVLDTLNFDIETIDKENNRIDNSILFNLR